MRNNQKDFYKSEIFAVIKTINNLNLKYNKGLISDTFYAKSTKSAYRELLEIHFKIKEEGLDMSDILNQMKYMDEYRNAIEILNSVGIEDSKGEASRLSMLELPGMALEIASSLITLMDILKLGVIENPDLINKSFDELTVLFEKFPGLDKISEELSVLRKDIIENKKELLKNNKYRDYIGDKLYNLYQEFRHKLNL